MKKNKKPHTFGRMRFVSLLIITAAVFALPGNYLYAKEKNTIQTPLFQPALGYTIQYNDNISLTRHKNKDFVHTFTPSLRLAYTDKSPQFVVIGSYLVDIVTHSDYKKKDFQKHAPFISIKFRTPSNIYGSIVDQYVKTADSIGIEDDYGVGRKTRRSSNYANLKLGYGFTSHAAIEGAYSNTLNWFTHDEDKWQEREDHTLDLSLRYILTPKTSFLLTYQRKESTYPRQNDEIDGWSKYTSKDNSKNNYLVGFHFSPRGKINGRLKLGFGGINYKNDIDKDGNNFEDLSTWISEVDINYKATEKTVIVVTVRRHINSASIPEASSYTNSSFKLGCRQTLLQSFLLSLNAQWEILEYDLYDSLKLPEKEYNYFIAGAGIDYAFHEALNAGLEYTYKTREATYKAYADDEYNNNIIQFHIKASF